MVKKLIAVMLAVFVSASIGLVVSAAMEPYEITYNIHSANENDIVAEHGDIITVTFEMIRTDSTDPTFILSSYQNEIEYDMDFFDLIEDSLQINFVAVQGAKIIDTRTSGQQIIKASDREVELDREYVVCTFDLEVIATHGSGTVRTSYGKCRAWDNSVNPPKTVPNNVTQKNLTVTIDTSSLVSVESVTLSPASKTLTAVGETFTLTPAIAPDNASNKNVTYSSNDESVATVDDDGVVTAVSNGTAVITVTTEDGGKTATSTVTVDIPPATVNVTGVSVSPLEKSLKVGKTLQLEVTVYPENATDKSVIYKSSRPSVATVSSTGLVKAMVKGTTTITVTTVDGGKTATSEITVTSDGGGGGGGGGTSERYTLSFETNGGMEVTSVKAKEGTKLSLDKYATDKPGFKFDGWYFDKELTKEITEVVLDKDMTVYAKWVKVEEEEKDEPIDQTPDYKPEILTDEHYAYIIGREGGFIAPQSDITRAEVATIIYRLLDEDVRNKAKTKDNAFADVNEDDWFNTAVSTLAGLGLVNGRTSDTFAPNAYITRAELATIFARMVEVKYDGKVVFSDVAGHWAQSYINEAATAEWIVGYNGLFRPDDNITRAEVMTLVNRVLNREPESKDDLLEGMATWKDNADENAWYYLAVQEATNSHEYEIKADGKHEKWTALGENPDWEALEK